MAAECGALRLPTGNKYQQALVRPSLLYTLASLACPGLVSSTVAALSQTPSQSQAQPQPEFVRAACLSASLGVSLSSFCLQQFKPCVSVSLSIYVYVCVSMCECIGAYAAPAAANPLKSACQ